MLQYGNHIGNVERHLMKIMKTQASTWRINKYLYSHTQMFLGTKRVEESGNTLCLYIWDEKKKQVLPFFQSKNDLSFSEILRGKILFTSS